MRNAANLPSPPKARRRSRLGYDPEWWGEAGRVEGFGCSYWDLTRRPMPSLFFVIPILLAYEIGVACIGGSDPGALRTGIDGWFRQGLASVRLSDAWLPPAALIGILLVWQSADHRSWTVRPSTLLGMLLESLVLAIALIGISRLIDLGLDQIEHVDSLVMQAVPGSSGAHSGARLLGFLGAGVYEEAIFRLLLIPALFGALRVLLVPEVLAGALAVTGSALVFSLAHHVGLPGEAFTWYAFVFRWFAGVYFAWAFVTRGFGVAVGTHVFYDCLVGFSESPA